MENQYFKLEERLHNLQGTLEGIELLYLIDTFCPIIYNNTEGYESNDIDNLIDKTLVEKTLEGFFKELNLLNEYLNNMHLKEKNRFIGLDTLKIEVEQRKQALEELLANGMNKEIYDIAMEVEDEALRNHVNGVMDDGKVMVTMTGTIKDIYVIMHENIHKIYNQSFGQGDQAEEKDSVSYFNEIFLDEVPSMTAELALRDYLERNRMGKEANKFIMWRFDATRKSIAQFHFDMILIRLYNKYHQITDKLIEEELLKEEEPLRTDLIQQKQTYIKYFSTPLSQLPYVFGNIAACTLKDKVQNQPEILNDVGKSIYDNNLIETLSRLGIGFIESYETTEKNLFGVYKKMNYKLNEEKRLEMIENYFKEYNKLFTQKRR